MELKNKFLIICRITLPSYLFIILISAALSSCKNEGNDISSNCIGQSVKPDSAFLSVKVSMNSENPHVILTIYRDKFDPNRKDSAGYIEIIDTTNKENTNDKGVYSHKVPVDHYYSVKAKYKSGQKIIYVVDGVIFQAQTQSGCDNTSWQMVGGNLDATLVFSK
jgi:hypothetical protein